MTELTREQVAALLDGTTPGPWRKRDCDVVVGEGLTAKTICHFWRHWSNDEDGIEQTEPNARLTAAAPDLARQLLAAMDRLADADMAQAALVERAAEIVEDCDIPARWIKARAIRALAPDAGMKDLAALRGERDALKAAVEGLIAVLDRNDKKGPVPDVEMMFCWLAAQDVRAAFRKIAPKGDAT